MMTSKRRGADAFEPWERDEAGAPTEPRAEGGSLSYEWRRFRRQMDHKIKRLVHGIDRRIRELAAAGPDSGDAEALDALRSRALDLAGSLEEEPEGRSDWRALQASVSTAWDAISKEASALRPEAPAEGLWRPRNHHKETE